jgi:pyruvate kinase
MLACAEALRIHLRPFSHTLRPLPPTNRQRNRGDIDFAVQQKLDFLAVSFVRGPDVLNNLRSYLQARDRDPRARPSKPDP